MTTWNKKRRVTDRERGLSPRLVQCLGNNCGMYVGTKVWANYDNKCPACGTKREVDE